MPRWSAWSRPAVGKATESRPPRLRPFLLDGGRIVNAGIDPRRVSKLAFPNGELMGSPDSLVCPAASSYVAIGWGPTAVATPSCYLARLLSAISSPV